MKKGIAFVLIMIVLAGVAAGARETLWASVHGRTELTKDENWIAEALEVENFVTTSEGMSDVTELLETDITAEDVESGTDVENETDVSESQQIPEAGRDGIVIVSEPIKITVPVVDAVPGEDVDNSIPAEDEIEEKDGVDEIDDDGAEGRD